MRSAMNCFFDANVIVHAYDPGAGVKQVQAHALMERHAGDRTITVSTQVLQETYSVLVRNRYLDPGKSARKRAREPAGKRATKR